MPARSIRTVSFQVKVKDNAEDSATRRAEDAPLQGYALRNYLTERTVEGGIVTPPATCVRPGEGSTAKPTCTEHPVLAWEVEKDSQPLDGASLHAGGDLHYKITVRKLNPAAEGDITDIVVTDDLTEVFKAARWYPQAPVPYPGLQRGIYFYNADGSAYIPSGNSTNRLPDRATDGAGMGASEDDVTAANSYVKPPVFTPDLTAGVCDPDEATPGPTQPACFNGTWELQTSAFTLPSDAAYAEVWFSVRIGFSSVGSAVTWADSANEAQDIEPNWSQYWMPRRQVSNASFQNLTWATGTGEDGTPISCSSQETAQADSLCSVAHKVEANYFVIRKDLLHRDANGTMVRDINLVGHELSLYMEDTGGNQVPLEDVQVQRQKLDAEGNGLYLVEGQELTTGDCTEQGKECAVPVMQTEDLMCADWDVPGAGQDNERCARFRPIATGAQAGRWRADRLPAGTYWLEETTAPTAIRTGPGNWDSSTNTVPVDGAQVIPERIRFRVSQGNPDEQQWVLVNGTLQAQATLPGQLDVFDEGQTDGRDVFPRCQIPYREEGTDISALPTACINPTGYVMVLTDITTQALPRAGASGINTITCGAVLLGIVTCGALWWRRRPDDRKETVGHAL